MNAYTGSIPALPRAADWRDSAACRDEDPELFFAHDTNSVAIDHAMAICARCPVRRQCLADAIDRENASRPDCRYGIYGGLTGPQRANLWRRQQRRKLATA